MSFKLIPTIVSILLALLIILFIPIPLGITREGWILLGIFVGTISAIIGKAMPIGAISVIAIMLVALARVTSADSSEAIQGALSSFSNPLIWMIGFSIIISRGIIKTGLGKRIGYYFISVFGKKTLGIAYGLTLSELVLAPITPSNTARGGAIIHPIMKSIAFSYDSDPKKKTEGLIGKYLSLVNYQANPITSAMFITATAPNSLIVFLIHSTTNGAVSISWSMWAIAMILPGVIALFFMPIVLYYFFSPEIKSTPQAPSMAKEKLKELGPLSIQEKIMLGIFTVLLLFWADVPEKFLGSSFHISPTTTALIGLVMMLLTNVLSWDEVLKEKSAWDTIIWFSALIMMATYLNSTGVMGWLTEQLKFIMLFLNLNWFLSFIVIILIFFYTHYIFASVTAHVTAMFGAFLLVGLGLDIPILLLALMMAAASGLMMSLTHYATGTSPIIFASSFTTLGEWWKAGFIMSIVNLFIWFIVGGIWWKMLGYW